MGAGRRRRARDPRRARRASVCTALPRPPGGKGLHVVVPLTPELGWDEIKSFTKAVADHLAAQNPQRYTANQSKRARHGRIYIDYLRNARGATAIGAYSTRARPGAPVATPLFWREVEAGGPARSLYRRHRPRPAEGADIRPMGRDRHGAAEHRPGGAPPPRPSGLTQNNFPSDLSSLPRKRRGWSGNFIGGKSDRIGAPVPPAPAPQFLPVARAPAAAAGLSGGPRPTMMSAMSTL